jgi:hypothetical protein
VPVEAQMVAEEPTKVAVLVPVEAQKHRCWCQWKHRDGGGGSDESGGAGASGSTGAQVTVPVEA